MRSIKYRACVLWGCCYPSFAAGAAAVASAGRLPHYLPSYRTTACGWCVAAAGMAQRATSLPSRCNTRRDI